MLTCANLFLNIHTTLATKVSVPTLHVCKSHHHIPSHANQLPNNAPANIVRGEPVSPGDSQCDQGHYGVTREH